MTSLLSIFMRHFQILYQIEQILKKKFFDSMISLEMTLWPTDILTFTFYETFSKSIPNWAICLKQVFWFDDYFRKWKNDWFVTNDHLTFTFYLI